MLRQWNGDSLLPILKILEQFGLKDNDIKILKYECLSPDSFIWIFSSETGRYCLYAEDYVPSLDHVRKIIETHGMLNEEDDEYELIEVKNPTLWDESSPVATADVYTPPDNNTEFMKYAVPSGHDFVFLGRSLK